MRDINGKTLKLGDWIQGYNNRKYAHDKTKLFPTKPMKLPEYVGDTFEFHPGTASPWIWKLDILDEPMEYPKGMMDGMKYLERVRNNLHKILRDFIANEPEDTGEYRYILSMYEEVNFHISKEKYK